VGVAEAHRRVRERVNTLAHDRDTGPALAAVLALVHDGTLADLAG
jgi:histidine ammonia-lyase